MAIDTSVWRQHPQLLHLKAAFIKPVVVFARRVNQGAFTYPLAALTYDNPDGGAGVYTAVKEGMTLGVYSSADVFKGFLRIRKAPTGTVLYISEVSAGDVDFADNDQLVVYDDYRLWARVPRMTSDKTFYKDYDLTYGSQISYDGSGDKLLPVANTGPHRARDVDPTSGTVDFIFNGANSFRQAAGIGDALTYVWDFKDGTVISGSYLLSTATVRFPAGQRWVGLTVTDGNGKSGRAVCVVKTQNESTYPYAPVALQRLSGSVDSGWECAVSVLASDVSDVLPGTLMILYSDQYYDSVADNVNGYPDCENTLFVGWVDSEDLTIEAFQDELIITARSALGVLQTLPAFTASIERNLTPSKWHHQIYPNWFRGVVYLMQWHSTIPLVCDVERPSFWGDYLFPAADYTAGSLYDQLRSEAERAWARLTEDKTGRLFVRRNPPLMDDTERAALATTVHVQSTDWRDSVQIQRPARPRTGWMRGGGFTNNAGDLKLSLAPGDAPGQGLNQTEKNGMWITDQNELNERLGHAYAYENNDTPYLQLTLNHQGAGFDPAWQEVVEFTLAAATNRRGVGFTQDKFVVVSFDISHDPETGATTEVLTLEALTEGVPGTTQPVPTDTGGGGTTWEDEDWRPPDIDIDPYEPPPPEVTPGGSGNKNALLAVNRAWDSGGWKYYGMVMAADISAASPTWAKVMDGLPLVYGSPLTFTPQIRRMYLDTFKPEAAYLFMGGIGVLPEHGIVYYNPDWRNGGTWTALLTWQDVLDDGGTACSAGSLYVSDALVSFAEAGLCYIVVHPMDNTSQPSVIRVADYGSDVQYSPRLAHQPNFASYFNRDVSLAIGHDNPDKVWLDARYVSGHFIYSATWPTFPLDPVYGTRWYHDFAWSLTNAEHFLLNPYWKLDGSSNLDTQMFLCSPTGAPNNIYKSENHGADGSWADWTADGVVPYAGTRDRFDVPGKTGMRAWWRSVGDLKVLKTTDPAAITTYTIPGFTVDGFTLHWPFNPGQYYAAQNVAYSAGSPLPVLKMTLDADSGVWKDLTGNMYALTSALAGGHNVYVQGFCPHWTET